jgi:6-phosphogluconolactonase
MIEAEWWDYDSLDELADAVVGDVGFIVESAVDARGASLVAVPGGKTGPAIFPKLAARKLPWKRVTVIPTDDRLVPMNDERSNVRAIGKAFIPAGARVVPIATEISDYKLAGNSADARLQDLPWPPDLVWLGMGADGHTASIFAGPDLQTALDAPKARRAVGVMPDPLPEEARDVDARIDPVRADDPDHGDGPAEARAARGGDRRRTELEAADRASARRSRAADRHPLVSVRG